MTTNLYMEFDLDPKMIKGLDLDPRKTMDYVLFKTFNFRFIVPFEDRKSVEEIVERGLYEDVKTLPPLDVILFDGLVDASWGWDRLLPWKCDCVLFEDYFGYLWQHYDRNKIYPFGYLNVDIGDGEARLNATAATECMKAEAALNDIVAVHSGLKTIPHDHAVLSRRITDEALSFTELVSQPIVPAGSILPAACFMCITEEAKLMSKVLLTMSNTKADEFPGRLWQMYFEFCNEVRQVAVEILTTYKGPYSEQVSAAMLGMQREAIQASKLVDQEVDNIEDELEVSKDIREHLLDLLKIIWEFFPRQSEIKYTSIRDARISMGSNHIEHLCKPSEETESPITTRSAAPASPLPWSVNDNESCQSNTDCRKRKIMGMSQDSEMSSRQHAERRRDSGTAEELGCQAEAPSAGVAAPVTSTEESYQEKNNNKKKSKITQEVQGTEVASLQTRNTSMETLNDE